MSGYSRNGCTTACKVVFDWYKILQISPSSKQMEIKSAYYKIAQSAHPDKYNGCSRKVEQFKLINEAYDVLSNPTKRKEYDMQMQHHHHHHHDNNNNKNQSRKSSYQRRTSISDDDLMYYMYYMWLRLCIASYHHNGGTAVNQGSDSMKAFVAVSVGVSYLHS